MQENSVQRVQEPAASPMRGFDAEFVDIVDYILRITYRIWEGRQPDLCHRYYSADCPVYTLAGYVEGAEEVTQNTRSTLTSFPDRTLKADNIIWGGDDRDGYHSSHLIDTAMTNLGPSEFGAPTGYHARFRVIAHCVVRENRIVEEWLVRDNYSLCEQLGVDPMERARELARRPLTETPRFAAWLDEEFSRVRNGAAEDHIDGDFSERGSWLAGQLLQLWNDRALEHIEEIYADDALLHASARPDLEGRAPIREFFRSLQCALPDARLAVDYVCENSMQPGDHVAIRWTLAGHHRDNSLWGDPSGAPVLILAESHYRLEGDRVAEEWLVYDELAVLTQIERARAART